jgi:hypothetical protein
MAPAAFPEMYVGRSGSGTDKFYFNDPTSKRFCNDERPIDGIINDERWMSENQKLAGPANPKTKIPPVITPPCLDLDYWRATNLVTFPQINSESMIDVYRSGYQVSTCCAPSYNGCDGTRTAVPREAQQEYKVPLTPYFRNNGSTDYGSCPKQAPVQENFEFPYLKTAPGPDGGAQRYVQPELPGGMVNTSCGYNPQQLFSAGLPTNFPAGNCMQNPAMKQFNDNLFTQTIQPDVYTRSQIDEPINSNMGISFTQQFPPTTCKTDPMSGVVNYTEHDPRLYTPGLEVPNMCTASPITTDNVYDPRFTGYGTSYRSYTDDNLGQTKFYYDDVNAVRMPNYLVRSNVDHQPFADQYGPLQKGDEYGNPRNADIHALANDAFLNASIQQRTDLQQSLMRKVNAEQWQRRLAPISRQPRRMLGGLGSMNM